MLMSLSAVVASLPFPTRRSSDLHAHVHYAAVCVDRRLEDHDAVDARNLRHARIHGINVHQSSRMAQVARVDGVVILRSEEHTSELQSQSNLVCRLLLEKKKK